MTVSDTSREAHEQVKPRKPTLREMALEMLRLHGPLTADEAAEFAGVSPFAMRPRFTELKPLIEDTGDRRPSANNKTAVVWRLVNKPVKMEQTYMFPSLVQR